MDSKPSSSACGHPSSSTDSKLHRISDRDVQLHIWQKAAFADNGTGGRETADSIRLRLTQLECCYAKERTSGNECTYLKNMTSEYLQHYSQVMDERDESKGMNNLYSPVQVLTAGQKKECNSWKSGLTYDMVINMPEVKSLLTQQKIFDRAKSQSASISSCRPTAGMESNSISSNNRIQGTSATSGDKTCSILKPCGSLYRAEKAGSQATRPSGSGFSYPPSDMCSRIASQDRPINAYATSKPSKTIPRHRGAFGSDTSQPCVKRMRMTGRTPDECGESAARPSAFITARDQHVINQQKQGRVAGGGSVNSTSYGMSKKSLGTRRTTTSRFVPPVKRGLEDDREGIHEEIRSRVLYSNSGGGGKNSNGRLPPELEGDERLRNIEPRMVELIMNEIMDHSVPVQWDDIAGLHFAKDTIKEIVVWPMMRPDIFKGLRGPPKGILLFGPPGTGKTLIGKCIASQVNATFFSISASSLTSKWVGEGEKMVRALFAVARCYQPAVIFIDEIDSLLSQRSDTEHESSRRIKTEFLVQLDGATCSDEDKLLVIGATNRPQEIDEAARRRLVKRLYIPLPDFDARKQIIANLMKQQVYSLSEDELKELCTKTEGYSGADMTNLCREASYGPVREAAESIQDIAADDMRPIHYKDFENAISVIRPSVSEKDLGLYVDWNKQFGCGTRR